MRAGADLESLFARVAESVANASLRLDRASEERLAALEGRSVQVESMGPGQVWSVRVSDARIEVLPGLVDSPDALVRGKLQDLLAWLASPDSSAAERVEIEGNAAVPAELAGVFRALAPQGLLTPVHADDLLGAAELAAAVLSSAAEGAAGAWRQASSVPFVNRDSFGAAQGEIESLRAEVERLSARVGTLECAGEARSGAGEKEAAQAGSPDQGIAESSQSRDAPE